MTRQTASESKASAEPNELLAWLQKENPPLIAEDAFVVPLWFSQQSAWLEDRFNSDNAVYNYPLLLRIRGPLNEVILQQSLQEIVRRQETLRSMFRMRNGKLVQIVLPPAKLTLSIIDLSGLPESEEEAAAQGLALEEALQPFDLTKAPLLRTVLMRLGSDDHILQLTSHHLVHDDWSTTILFRELSELYQAFAAGTASPLADLVFQYGDYVRWHEDQFRGKAAKLAYWKQQLASTTTFQHLATDFPRPQRCSNRGAHENLTLPADLLDQLKTLSRDERISVFMVLLAGFQCLLHRYSGHQEIGIVSCAANRPLMEVERLMGRFGNDILLRTNLSGNATFRELFTRVRESCLTAYSDQDLPFGEVLKDFGNAADSNRGLPFQVMFILQNVAKEDPQVPGLAMNWMPLDTGTAKYDLAVWLKLGSMLEVTFEYRPELFRAATMKQILDNYQTILQTIARDPGARIHNLPMPRKAEPAASAAVAKPMPKPKDNIAPKDDAQSRLVKLWEAAFGVHPIGVDADFFELGGDSLLAARLFTQIEKTLSIELPLAALLEAPTIKQLAEIISGRKSRLSRSSLVVIQSGGTNLPLFCVHGHMGEIFFCRNLSRSLGPNQPVFGLRSQGLGGEAPHYMIEDMAVRYVSEIRTVQPKGPYFLSGYCFGGMVAYEMARLLRSQSEDVALLALFNTPAPGSLGGWPLRQTYLTKRIGHELRKLHALAIPEKLVVLRTKTAGLARLVSGNLKAALWHALARSSSTHSAEKRAQRFLSVEDINVSAAKAYRPGAYPGRIVLFLTEEATSLYAIDPRDGWMALAGEGVEVHRIAGDNSSMFDERYVNALTEKLKSSITKAYASGLQEAAAMLQASS